MKKALLILVAVISCSATDKKDVKFKEVTKPEICYKYTMQNLCVCDFVIHERKLTLEVTCEKVDKMEDVKVEEITITL